MQPESQFDASQLTRAEVLARIQQDDPQLAAAILRAVRRQALLKARWLQLVTLRWVRTA